MSENLGQVLIVDDDALYRGLVAEWLSAAGYAVCEAGDGEEALSVLDAAAIALMITDVDMPGLDGPELLRALRGKWPALPVIAASGRFATKGTDKRKERMAEFGVNRFLAKPFSREALLAAVEAVAGGT
jgi:DNA-binding response OmpR family regulator